MAGISASKINLLKKAFVSYYEYIAHKERIRAEDEGWIGKVIDIIDYPFKLIREYTIIPADEEEYDHHYTKYWPFLGILFLMW